MLYDIQPTKRAHKRFYEINMHHLLPVDMPKVAKLRKFMNLNCSTYKISTFKDAREPLNCLFEVISTLHNLTLNN